MISYILDQNILVISFIGKINNDDIFNYLHEFSSIADLPSNLLLLYDLLNAELEVAPSDIKKISTIADSSTKKYQSVKTAFLVNDPKLTAYSTLFTNLANPNKTQRKIFSTKEAALKWLKQSNN